MPEEPTNIIKWKEEKEKTPENLNDRDIEITSTRSVVKETTLRQLTDEVENARLNVEEANKRLEEVTAKLAEAKTSLGVE